MMKIYYYVISFFVLLCFGSLVLGQYTSIQDASYYGEQYFSQGMTYDNAGQNKLAINYYLKAAEAMTYVMNNSNGSVYTSARNVLLSVYGLIGGAYCEDKSYDNAFFYFDKSFSLGYDYNINKIYSICKASISHNETIAYICESGLGSNLDICSCPNGYEYNVLNGSCTKKSLDCSQYGPNVYLGSDNECHCIDGYERSPSDNACVKITEEYADKSCKNSYGSHSIVDPKNYDYCLCENGYDWNDDRTSCIKGSYMGTISQTTDDFDEAYKFAYANGITTMETIEKADMNGNLTRIAMAKMISNYAINVLSYTYAYSSSCDFKDVSSSLNAQYDNGVIKACELGLMGQNMPNNKFRPYDTVTRAEFATVLSRLLNRGTENLVFLNAGTPYYREHLKYLEDQKIIDNKVYLSRNDKEKRGYVMLMLMRSNNNYSTAVSTTSTKKECTSEELLACLSAQDYDGCIEKCSR